MYEVNAIRKDLEKTQLNIFFEGKRITTTRPICRDINRIYLPLGEFMKKLNGMISHSGKRLVIDLPGRSAIYSDYKGIVAHNNELYISLVVLCELAELITVWLYESQTVSLYFRKDSRPEKMPGRYTRPALIRLEDITAGGKYLESRNLENLRVLGDFLYSSKIPFHIAWIPRYVDPPNMIDNDISSDYSIENAHFLFTIDYLLYRGGIIGLHGYTHQYGDEVSGYGTEFSESRNNDEKSVQKRVQSAIDAANKLSLPYSFFESPHFASTSFQQSIYEGYFDIIYESCVGVWGDTVVKSPRNRKTVYVPTPLGYLEDVEGLDNMLERIYNLNDIELASLFYHPYYEFDYITVTNMENGYPLYHYSADSPLHMITDAVKRKNCQFTKVTSFL